MQNKVSDRIHAEYMDQIIRIEDVALGLGHLAVRLQQPRMSEYLLGKRQIQAHQEGGPVDGMEADDVLADQVKVSRPVLLIDAAGLFVSLAHAVLSAGIRSSLVGHVAVEIQTAAGNIV